MINLTTQQLTLTTAAPTDTANFNFKNGLGNIPEDFNGYICVSVKPTTVSGDTDTLTITAKPIVRAGVSDAIPANGSITLASALDWTDEAVYTFPIIDAIGPCAGIQVGADITGAEAGTELTLDIYVTIG